MVARQAPTALFMSTGARDISAGAMPIMARDSTYLCTLRTVQSALGDEIATFAPYRTRRPEFGRGFKLPEGYLPAFLRGEDHARWHSQSHSDCYSP